MLALQRADGRARPQELAAIDYLVPSSVTSKGHVAATNGRGDVLVVTVDRGKARVGPLLESPYGEAWPAFSPDGHWLAYGSPTPMVTHISLLPGFFEDLNKKVPPGR